MTFHRVHVEHDGRTIATQCYATHEHAASGAPDYVEKFPDAKVAIIADGGAIEVVSGPRRCARCGSAGLDVEGRCQTCP